MLRKYADLIVSVGLNLQRGQPLIIYSASSRGVALHNAPVVAEVTRAAYAAGASFVDVIWNDASSIRTRLQQATRETAAEYATWHIKALMDTIEAGGAMLTIRSNDPELLQGLDADTVAIWQRTHLHHFDPVLRAVTSNKINWCVVAAAGRAWAERIFPGLSPAKAEAQLWKAIFQMIRLDQPDPIAIWHKHLASLRRHADYLNERRYETLKYAGPGTDLTLSLPEGHRWIAARERTQSGIDFTANIPTEEVFTLPHRLGAEGTVRATMPLIYGGQRIEGFSLSFKRGRITDVSARTGEALLRELTTADEGASFLGEIALVSESSPIARRKTLFLDSLIDENAASHLAIGRAYRTCMQAADSIDDEEFLRRGGNTSIVHEDFMIGSDRLDVDGILPDGTSEPIMRGGEWAFDL
jgi:aminopeptidase